MKVKVLLIIFLCFSFSLFSESDDDLFFEEDDLIEVLDTKAKDDVSLGVLYENGSVNLGGNFTTSLSTSTLLYSDSNKTFSDNVKDTTITPVLKGNISIDARVKDDLRMYTSFCLTSPFTDKVKLNGVTGLAIDEWLKVNEVFTDFSIKDRAFFRFGLHTASWGTGYFFSPMSDIINTSQIDPLKPDNSVKGCLNLRSQIIFPGTTNCLWFYIIPPNNAYSNNFARDTAFALKYDYVIGGWEIGVGGFYKYETSPKLTFTTSGSVKKVSIFSEMVYQYGATKEWTDNKKWDNKTSIFQGTIGFKYSFDKIGLLMGGQYYYDSNNIDFTNRSFSNGHNIAMSFTFSKFGKIENLLATIAAVSNIGREGYNEEEVKLNLPPLPVLTIMGDVIYKISDNIILNIGPTFVFDSYDKCPTSMFNFGVKLGGGEF